MANNLAIQGKGRRYVDNIDEIKTTDQNSLKDTSSGETKTVEVVHHVPFRVDYEGQANVDTKFTSKSVPLEAESKVLSNQFRGRPLQGRVLTLPEDYEGLVAMDLGKSRKNLDDEDEEEMTEERTEISLTKRFDTMTYWNWDRVPTGMDKHMKLIDWLEISQILHAPIDDLIDGTLTTTDNGS